MIKASLKELFVVLAGFAVGAVVGYAIARLQGFDVFVPAAGQSSLAGLVLTALGGLIGLRIARRWHSRHHGPGER